MPARPARPHRALTLLSGLALLVGTLGCEAAPPGDEVPISRVASAVTDGRVERIVAEGDRLQVFLRGGQRMVAHKEPGVSVPVTLRDYGVGETALRAVTVEVERATDLGWLWNVAWLVPLFLLLGLAMRRRGQAGGAVDPSQAFGVGKSTAKKITVERPTVRFDDVAGVDEAKEEVQEVVDFLRTPDKFVALGARIPKGLLLYGPPGTGKTLLARAIAGEAGTAFFSQAASEFVELFVGVGASRVRDLFKQAREASPAIIFIDEVDAIGRRRSGGVGQSHEEREQTLNQILAEMDGFDPRTNVVVVAATNRPDVLDPALLRPGRFDRRVAVEGPDLESRLAILKVHARGKPLEKDVDLHKLAKLTPGFSGADLENLLNEAALLAGRRGKRTIGMEEMEESADRVQVGPQRKGRRMSDREQEVTAYHEAGHALAAHLLPHADPVHKISIVARGASGGHTRVLPEDERHYWTVSQLQDRLAYMLGGMAAEQIIFGETTTGPGSDLEQATKMARKMVLEYGMSEVVGPISMGQSEEYGFMLDGRPPISEETAAQVDREVRRLVQEARERATDVLQQHLDRLHSLAAAVREHETLQGEELLRALGARGAGQPASRLQPVAVPEPQPEPAPAPQPAPMPLPAPTPLPGIQAA